MLLRKPTPIVDFTSTSIRNIKNNRYFQTYSTYNPCQTKTPLSFIPSVSVLLQKNTIPELCILPTSFFFTGRRKALCLYKTNLCLASTNRLYGLLRKHLQILKKYLTSTQKNQIMLNDLLGTWVRFKKAYRLPHFKTRLRNYLRPKFENFKASGLVDTKRNSSFLRKRFLNLRQISFIKS